MKSAARTSPARALGHRGPAAAGTDVSEESDRTERAVWEAMRAEFGGPGFRLLPALLVVAAAVVIAALVWAGGSWVP